MIFDATKFCIPLKLSVKLDKGAKLPNRKYDLDGGADLYTPKTFILKRNSYKTIDTGVHVEIPQGFVGLIKSKSGLMTKNGILTDGTVDAGYTGSIRVCLFNHGFWDKKFKAGDMVAQLVIIPVAATEFYQTENIGGGDRGESGFGSTGR